MRRDHGEVMAAVSNLNEASANIGGDIVTSPMKENNYLSCTVFRLCALLGSWGGEDFFGLGAMGAVAVNWGWGSGWCGRRCLRRWSGGCRGWWGCGVSKSFRLRRHVCACRRL